MLEIAYASNNSKNEGVVEQTKLTVSPADPAGAEDAEEVTDRKRGVESIVLVDIVNTSYLFVQSVIKSMFHIFGPSESKGTSNM